MCRNLYSQISVGKLWWIFSLRVLNPSTQQCPRFIYKPSTDFILGKGQEGEQRTSCALLLQCAILQSPSGSSILYSTSPALLKEREDAEYTFRGYYKDTLRTPKQIYLCPLQLSHVCSFRVSGSCKYWTNLNFPPSFTLGRRAVRIVYNCWYFPYSHLSINFRD